MQRQGKLKSWILRNCRNPRDFSFLNLFELPRGDDNVELRTKFREIGIFYWACLIFSPYFIAEQYFSFQSTRYWWILIPLYALLVLSPLVYRISKRINLYASYIIFIEISIVLVIMGCAGGNLSPGAFWLVGFPMIFGLFYGVRGVAIGSTIMVGAFAVFVVMNYFQVLPNLIAEHGDYEHVKLVNLIGFGIYNIVISFYSIKIEATAKAELRLQRQETENLLRILVHDIATPINAVQLMTHAMKAGGQKPEQVFSVVESALNELIAIVQQVSKLRALKDGKLAIELSEVHMQDALNECLTLVQQIALRKNLRIQLTAPDEPVYALVDAALIKSVILCNIISNAIKFSHPGNTINISLTASEPQVSITVTDHGIGMSAELLQCVFDPGQPTTRVGTQGEQGTGFGLPLVKMLVNKLDGDITIQSNQSTNNPGTIVTVSLPRAYL